MEKEILEKYGFKKLRPFRKTSKYTLRIHATIFLEFDCIDSFMTLMRFKEVSVKDRLVKITIPKKIETESDLSKLLEALM